MVRRAFRVYARVCSVALVLALGACGQPAEDEPPPVVFGGDRPVTLDVPEALAEGERYPLLLVLHGFGASGLAQASYLGVGELAETSQAFVIAPDGMTNSMGRQFWNADPACCDLEGQRPDDVAYLGGLIDDILASWPIDPAAVYVIGHSNGGFMAYRMACERADVIAAIAPLAGLAASVPASCVPTRPVSVLHMHGTADPTVPYAGGGTGIAGLGASGSVAQWASHNSCGSGSTAGAELDLDSSVAGSETHPEETNGCPEDGEVELWRMEGSGHIPIFGPAFVPAVMQWFTDHRRS